MMMNFEPSCPDMNIVPAHLKATASVRADVAAHGCPTRPRRAKQVRGSGCHRRAVAQQRQVQFVMRCNRKNQIQRPHHFGFNSLINTRGSGKQHVQSSPKCNSASKRHLRINDGPPVDLRYENAAMVRTCEINRAACTSNCPTLPPFIRLMSKQPLALIIADRIAIGCDDGKPSEKSDAHVSSWRFW